MRIARLPQGGGMNKVYLPPHQGRKISFRLLLDEPAQQLNIV
jgi:hypothetical protein